jgi:polyisoprenoid-binding protein YceI
VNLKTNYLLPLAAVMLAAGACHAETPAAAPKPAAKPAAAPAPVPAPTDAAPRWVQAPSGSSLTITFDQAGAASTGSFKRFTTELTYDEKSPATGSLKVTVQIGSVDTQDKERNETIVGADLFNAQKFPTAQYSANSFLRNAGGGIDAVGKLTLRGVTRDLRVPLKIVSTAAGLDLSGETAIKRLDYGVGQGDWQSTEGVGDEIKIQYKVALVKAK